ncbi:MAG: molybdopterin-synthase adenylyltransferase MoeB [Gammaproteobacteria bacterium]|nr:molybdopterin-synthase adenylyltransferase MoeB [Gammaproteobacteria bacterium]
MAIKEISPREALLRAGQGARLIDVREDHERAAGMAEGAVGVRKAALESAPGEHIPAPGEEVILICRSGRRSAEAGEALARQGYANVASVAGGTERWQLEKLPMSAPDAGFDLDFHERYSRHMLLPEIGLEGQQRLQASRVLLLGAGGLGSPAAWYLAAAGVGTLRIADPDVVDRSNLHRQILHTDASIGTPKVRSASERLTALNPRTRIDAVQELVTSDNVERLIGDVDVVIDGADNFAIRYLLNDACVKLGKPLVYGAVHRFEGQVSVFDAGRHRGTHPCYRCLFPEPPPPEAAPNCSEAGVLGILPGVVGLLEATEAIKLLLGLGEPLRGRLLHFDAMGMRFRETRLGPDPDCPLCAPGREFPGYIDYVKFCAGTAA